MYIYIHTYTMASIGFINLTHDDLILVKTGDEQAVPVLIIGNTSSVLVLDSNSKFRLKKGDKRVSTVWTDSTEIVKLKNEKKHLFVMHSDLQIFAAGLNESKTDNLGTSPGIPMIYICEHEHEWERETLTLEKNRLASTSKP